MAVSRTVATLSAVGTFVLGTLSGVLGARYWPPLLDRFDAWRGSDVLYAHHKWPYDPCSPAPLAGLPGKPDPTAYDEIDRRVGASTLAESAPPVIYREGTIKLTLSSANSETVTVNDVSAKAFKNDAITPAWALIDDASGCGSSQQRLFDVTLSNGMSRRVDKGVLADPGAQVDKSAPQGAPGSSFTVSQTDTADVYVHVHTCDRNYEFGIVIAYTVNGREYEKAVGSREDPFRIAGGTARALYESTLEPGPQQVKPTSADRFPSC